METKPQPFARHQRNRRGGIGQFALSLLFAVFLAFVVLNFGFRSYRVFGQSMEPTLQDGDFLIVSKVENTLAAIQDRNYIPQRGEIIVFESPANQTKLIKRIIALPGERIVIKNGETTVYNNTHPQGFDPYQRLGVKDSFVTGNLSIVIPKGHVFVIGDNRRAGGSSDSRNEIGPVPSENIIGELLIRLWPLNRRHTF